MPESRRRSTKKAAIRRAAYQAFRDHGYHDASVEMICEHAGISKGSLYWHYDSKQDIFVDLLETWAREIMEEVYLQFDQATDQQEIIRAVSVALQREVHRGRVIVPLWLEFTALARREPAIRRALSKFYRRARNAVADVLRPITPGYSHERRQALASAIFGAYTGIVMQELADPGDVSAERLLDGFLALIGTWFDQAIALIATSGVPGNLAPSDLANFTRALPDEVRDRLQDLRSLTTRLAPTATQRLVDGDNALAFDDGGIFLLVRADETGLTVAFPRPGALDDPHDLLVGKDSRTRHVVVASSGTIPEGLDQLILQAAGD